MANFTKLFAALSETLQNQVRRVTAEKNEMTEEAQRIITTMRQMEASLDDRKSRHEYEAEDENFKITYPLARCLQGLKEKHSQIAKLHKERFEQVKSKHILFLGPCDVANMLIANRARTSPRVVLIPLRALFHQDLPTSYITERQHPANLRPLPYLCYCT